jgi:hypothetical protein
MNYNLAFFSSTLLVLVLVSDFLFTSVYLILVKRLLWFDPFHSATEDAKYRQGLSTNISPYMTTFYLINQD